MNVQNIQPTYNINCKAKFINDNNGYLADLWNNAKKDYTLYKAIQTFVEKNKNDLLEITDLKKGKYTVFNHTNDTIYNFQARKKQGKETFKCFLQSLDYELSTFKSLLANK